MKAKERAALAVKVVEMVEKETDNSESAFEVLGLAVSLMFGVEYRLHRES